jgi:hypothetical protein
LGEGIGCNSIVYTGGSPDGVSANVTACAFVCISAGSSGFGFGGGPDIGITGSVTKAISDFFWITLIIHAALWNHVISLPAVVVGAGMVWWAPPISAAYAGFFRATGPRRLERAYSSERGLWTIRLAGVAFVGFGIYWAIVGTG